MSSSAAATAIRCSTTSAVFNRVILAGVATELALLSLIVYTPVGNFLFGTAPIGPELWLFTVPFALGMLLLEEFRKWLARRRAVQPILHGSLAA
jgi:hypothetical protein